MIYRQLADSSQALYPSILVPAHVAFVLWCLVKPTPSPWDLLFLLWTKAEPPWCVVANNTLPFLCNKSVGNMDVFCAAMLRRVEQHVYHHAVVVIVGVIVAEVAPYLKNANIKILQQMLHSL